ncbi:MAG TPA: hypothetical protein VF611_15135 [Pyrinomonadaceae bacterium]|jgi:hypothetical protein
MKSARLLALSAALLFPTAAAHARATPPQETGRGLSTREFDTSAPAEAQTRERAAEAAPCAGSVGGTATIMVDPLLIRPDPNDPSPARRAPTPCEPASRPSWYLEIYSFEQLIVSDSYGNTDRLYSERAARQTVRDVSYNPLCAYANCVTVIMSTGEGYAFKIRPGVTMHLKLVRGVGNESPDVAVSYRNLNLPGAAWALLTITPRGPEDLRVDKDGDGRFETAVVPTASLTGPAARDRDGPVIEFGAEARDSGDVLLTVKASDPTGVSRVLYSLDGRAFRDYGGPFKVDAARTPVVHVLAYDGLGNHSGIQVYRPGQKPPRRAH